MKNIVAALLVGLSSADQPVHCLREDIYGSWTFNISNEQQTVNLFETQSVCTHEQPNKIQIVDAKHEFSFANQETLKVKLLDNYKAEAQQCEAGGKCSEGVIAGKWSTVYDQAMKVDLDNGMRFLANFRYNVKSTTINDPLNDDIS